MTDEPTMKDSGERRTFASGAVRDRGGFKPRPDLISPHANLREGAWLAKGAEKYGARNYEKGIPISECVASLNRHLEAYKLGLQDEDHITAIRTNAGFIIHFEEEIKAGRMDQAIDDMPKYTQDSVDPAAVPFVTGFPFFRDEAEEDHKVAQAFFQREGHHPDAYRIEKCPPDSAETPDDDGPLYGIDYTHPDCPIKLINNRGETMAYDSDKNLWIPKPAASDREKARYESRPCVYIAGPMRGIEDFNFPLFDEAAEYCAALFKWNVVSPAQLDRAAGIDPLTYEDTPKNMRTVVKRDINAILQLRPDKDGMVLLPGWTLSTGARAEVALALWLGIHKFHEYVPADDRHERWISRWTLTELRRSLFGQRKESIE